MALAVGRNNGQEHKTLDCLSSRIHDGVAQTQPAVLMCVTESAYGHIGL